MKKSLLSKIIVAILLFVMIIPVTACSNESVSTENIEYGVAYSVPYGAGVEASVTDPSGKRVSIVNDQFIPDKDGTYKLVVKSAEGNKVTNLVVTDTTAPVIKTDYIIRYAEVGDAVTLPETIVSDNRDKNLTCEAFVRSGDTDTKLTADYTFPEVGNYEIVLKSKDAKGNGAEKVITYSVVEKYSDKASIIAEFTQKRGLDHIADKNGINATYQKAIKRAGEEGAVKITSNGTNRSGDDSFKLVNVADYDISNKYALYINVYNPNSYAVRFVLNNSVEIFLKPDRWNEVFVSDLTLLEEENGDNAISLAYSNKNINGLTVRLGDYEKNSNTSVYLSDLYAFPFADAEAIETRISRLPEVFTSEVMDEVNMLNKHLTSMTVGSKEKIRNYASYTQRLNDFYASEYPTTPNDDKAYYFDSPLGEMQVGDAYCEYGSGNFFSMTTTFTSEKKYGDEGGSIKVELNHDCWNFYFILGVDNLEASNYSKAVFRVYHEIEGCVLNFQTAFDEYKIPSGEWCEVEFPFPSWSDGIINESFYVFGNDWAKLFTTGEAIYISAIYYV